MKKNKKTTSSVYYKLIKFDLYEEWLKAIDLFGLLKYRLIHSDGEQPIVNQFKEGIMMDITRLPRYESYSGPVIQGDKVYKWIDIENYFNFFLKNKQK